MEILDYPADPDLEENLATLDLLDQRELPVWMAPQETVSQEDQVILVTVATQDVQETLEGGGNEEIQELRVHQEQVQPVCQEQTEEMEGTEHREDAVTPVTQDSRESEENQVKQELEEIPVWRVVMVDQDTQEGLDTLEDLVRRCQELLVTPELEENQVNLVSMVLQEIRDCLEDLDVWETEV